MNLPVSTYRLQLQERFTFYEVASLLEYFSSVGVSHLYFSPFFEAREGSTHGYDVTDPRKIRDAFTERVSFEELLRETQKNNLGMIIDVVPNHMAVHADNPYLWDVFKHGPDSQFSSYFDVEWKKSKKGVPQIYLPILGESLKSEIKKGTLLLDKKREEITYYDWRFPLSPESLPLSSDSVTQALLDKQHYSLVSHKKTGEHLNFRRFFDINELIAVQVEHKEVFKRTHALILFLAGEKHVDGVRIDHIDGLSEPRAYLDAMYREAKHPYMLVEKILGPDETLPAKWPVAGTTGYEFIRDIDNLFTDEAGLRKIEKFYLEHETPYRSFEEAEKAGKELVLRTILSPDLRRLSEQMEGVSEEDIISGIVEFPFYRTYISKENPDTNEDEIERWASVLGDHPLVKYLQKINGGNEEVLDCAIKLQQLSAPAAAKGVEDTAFYTWIPLLSRNEVGAYPPKVENNFHEQNEFRAKKYPRGMLSLTTHDTKRSADARFRLSVLSEKPELWTNYVEKFEDLTKDSAEVDWNTRYHFYQVALCIHKSERKDSVQKRLAEYMIKASREAKLNTTWRQPDKEFEKALTDYIRASYKNSDFYSELTELYKVVQPAACWASLSARVLQMTSPGIPDIYQGDEDWKYCLVDPDNRGDVNFTKIKASHNTSANQASFTKLSKRHSSSGLKQFLIWRLLSLRQELPDLMRSNKYDPIDTGSDEVVAFRRGGVIVVAATRFFPFLDEEFRYQNSYWGELTLGDVKGSWMNYLSGKPVRNDFSLANLCKRLPFAVLKKP